MLSCTACIRRALNNPTPNLEYSRSLHLRARSLAPILFRDHSTLRAIRTGHHRRELLQGIRKPTKNNADPAKSLARKAKREALKDKDELARRHNRERLLKSPASRSKIEESILSDRVQLASEVLNLLKKDQLVKALSLCRLSERSINGAPPIDSVVSWNHVIDWLMLKDDIAQAWKVFNEVSRIIKVSLTTVPDLDLHR